MDLPPSPLVGEGRGGGAGGDTDDVGSVWGPSSPPTPTLPHKGGGSKEYRSGRLRTTPGRGHGPNRIRRGHPMNRLMELIYYKSPPALQNVLVTSYRYARRPIDYPRSFWRYRALLE